MIDKALATLRHAKQIFDSAHDETQFRAAASRAYIATYQYLTRHPKISSFEDPKTAETHRELIEYLKGSNDPLLRKVGTSRLPRLRALRNHADYDLDRPFTKGLAQEAIEDAEEIIEDWLPLDS